MPAKAAKPAVKPAAKAAAKTAAKPAAAKTVKAKEVKKPVTAKFDKDTRYTGTVKLFYKSQGFGFITLDDKSITESDECFCFWKTIQSNDRYPFLHKGLEVEFGLSLRNGKLSASRVTLPGGESVQLQDANDGNHKSFLTGQDDRFSGHLKFYDEKKGFGFVTVSDDIKALNGVKDLKVDRTEVNAAGAQPNRMKEIDVEFGIWVNKKGEPRVYNMTGVGGMALTREFLENRASTSSNRMKGTVEIWDFKKGFGFIKPSDKIPAKLNAKMAEMLASAQKKAEKKEKTKTPSENLIYVRRTDLPPGTKLFKGTEVSFDVYTDDRGVGATNVQLL